MQSRREAKGCDAPPWMANCCAGVQAGGSLPRSESHSQLPRTLSTLARSCSHCSQLQAIGALSMRLDTLTLTKQAARRDRLALASRISAGPTEKNAARVLACCTAARRASHRAGSAFRANHHPVGSNEQARSEDRDEQITCETARQGGSEIGKTRTLHQNYGI